MAAAKRPAPTRVPRQGGNAAPHIAPPRTSGKPANVDTNRAPQTKRLGRHTPGIGGSNKGAR